MRRHETDWLALSLGGLFLVVAAVHLADQGAGNTQTLRWFIPGVLVVLGVLGLVGALRRDRPVTAGAAPVDVPSRVADHTEPTAPTEPTSPSASDTEPTVRLDTEGEAADAVPSDNEPTVRLDDPERPTGDQSGEPSADR